MSNPWFRLYSDFIFDEKIEFISFEDQRHFVFLLCMKNLGLLDKEYASVAMFERVVARRLGLFGEAFDSAKKRLVDSGLIDLDWQPINWNKRQFISDADPTNARRQREYRDRRKMEESNALRNVTVTLLDTDTDTEITPTGFTVFWQAFPSIRKGSKSKCEALWRKKKLESQSELIMKHLEFSKAEWAKEDNKYAPGALPYLNKEQWDGWEPISGKGSFEFVNK